MIPPILSINKPQKDEIEKVTRKEVAAGVDYVLYVLIHDKDKNVTDKSCDISLGIDRYTWSSSMTKQESGLMNKMHKSEYDFEVNEPGGNTASIEILSRFAGFGVVYRIKGSNTEKKAEVESKKTAGKSDNLLSFK